MDHTEVKVVTLPVSQWLEKYYRPEEFAHACELCPNYGNVWSCPALMQPAAQMLKPFSKVHLIGVKVVYRKETLERTDTAQKADHVRENTYDKVKRQLLDAILQMEKELPGSWGLAAGECKLCQACARRQGLPCRHPDKMRYSFSGLGFDLTRIARELFGYELLWKPKGLPEYLVAIGALLDREDRQLTQQYVVPDSRPMQVWQEEILGVLRQVGCVIGKKQCRSACNIYFDTQSRTLLQQDSILHVCAEPSGSRLIWKKSGARPVAERISAEDVRGCGENCPDTGIQGFIQRHLCTEGLDIGQLGPRVAAQDDQQQVELRDSATGDGYTLIFHHICYWEPESGQNHRECQLELVSISGSGRRLPQLAGCLQSRFPELQPVSGLGYPRGCGQLARRMHGG